MYDKEHKNLELNYQTWINEQRELSKHISYKDSKELVSLDNAIKENKMFMMIDKQYNKLALHVKNQLLVLGIDVAYKEMGNKSIAYCSLVFQNMFTFEIVAKFGHIQECNVPYIPTLFSYKEVPVIKNALDKVSEELLDRTMIVVFDGNGILHPRNMGIATQASLTIPKLKGKATIGIAKNLYSNADFELEIGKLKEKVGSREVIRLAKRQLENQSENKSESKSESRKTLGYAYRFKDMKVGTNSKSSTVYISQGNNITLRTMLKLIDNYCLNNKELPTKLADHETHILRHFEY